MSDDIARGEYTGSNAGVAAGLCRVWKGKVLEFVADPRHREDEPR